MFKPLNDNVLIKTLKKKKKTDSGLYIPETAQERPVNGVVVAVGPGKVNEQGLRVPLDIQVDDYVMYGKWNGTEVTLEGENYLLVKESDIIGVYDNVTSLN